MSQEQFKAFWEAVQADVDLQKKLTDAGSADDVVAIAHESGFMISAAEVNQAKAALADEELGGVAGGMSTAASRSTSGGYTSFADLDA
jgi:predicted ribosomally synthesized peptide with nif11-like leader